MGGSTNPDTDTHNSTVWVFPLSAAEIAYTFFLPNYFIWLEYNRYTTLITIIDLHWSRYQV